MLRLCIDKEVAELVKQHKPPEEIFSFFVKEADHVRTRGQSKSEAETQERPAVASSFIPEPVMCGDPKTLPKGTNKLSHTKVLSHLIALAIKFQHLELVQEITKDPCFVLDYNQFLAKYESCNFHLNALTLACYLGIKEAILLLVSQGANIHQSCFLPREFRNPEKIEKILNSEQWLEFPNTSVRLERFSAFELMLIHDRVDLLEKLLDKFTEDEDCDRINAGLKHRYLDGMTPLYLACYLGAKNCAAFLLKHEDMKEHVNLRYLWKSPLDVALDKGVDFIQLLIEGGARVSDNSISQYLQCYSKTDAPIPHDLVDTLHLLVVQPEIQINAKYQSAQFSPLASLLTFVFKELNSTWEESKGPLSQPKHQQLTKDALRLLIKHGAEVGRSSVARVRSNESQPLSLLMDIFKDCVRSLQSLYRREASMSAEKKEQSKTRILSCLNFVLELMGVLLDAGAYPDVLNSWRMSPLNQLYFLLSDIWLHLIPTIKENIMDAIRSGIALLLSYGAVHWNYTCIFYPTSMVVFKGQNSAEIAANTFTFVELFFNSLKHREYIEGLRVFKQLLLGVCDHSSLSEVMGQMHRREMVIDKMVCHHLLTRINDLERNPRSLKQIARACIMGCVKGRLVQSADEMHLPKPLVEYMLSFES